jgi:hypothetical protein
MRKLINAFFQFALVIAALTSFYKPCPREGGQRWLATREEFPRIARGLSLQPEKSERVGGRCLLVSYQCATFLRR